METRTESELRQRICEIGKMMHQKNFVAAGDGNISVRLERDRLLITPSGFSKGILEPDQLITINLDGEKLTPQHGKWGNLVPSSETRLHLECYRQRSDVQAVIHAHPPMAIACTLAGVSLAKCVLPEVLYDLGTIPTTKFALPTSAENAASIRDLVKTYDAIVLDRHGTVTVGETLWDAYMHLERVEHSAQVTIAASQIRALEPLSDEDIRKLAGMRQHVFVRRGRDVCAECNACPVSERHMSRARGTDVSRLEALIANEVRQALGG